MDLYPSIKEMINMHHKYIYTYYSSHEEITNMFWKIKRKKIRSLTFKEQFLYIFKMYMGR